MTKLTLIFKNLYYNTIFLWMVLGPNRIMKTKVTILKLTLVPSMDNFGVWLRSVLVVYTFLGYLFVEGYYLNFATI